MLYYEKADVRKYNRKNKKGIEEPYFQIRLKKDSQFRKAKPIALIDVAEIEEIAEKLDSTLLNENTVKYNELLEEHNKLKQQLQESKATNESLTSEVEDLKKEKLQLQEDLLKAKTKNEKLIEETNSKVDVANANVIESKENIEQLQKEHKEELSDLNKQLNEEKDNTIKEKDKIEGLLATITKITSEKSSLEKENIFLKNRSFFNRLINKQYTEEEKDVPEIIESEVKE